MTTQAKIQTPDRTTHERKAEQSDEVASLVVKFQNALTQTCSVANLAALLLS